MDLAPHSSVFLLGNDERGVNVARRLLIVHNDFGYRLDLVQMFDLILVVCWPWAVVRRLDIWEGIAHLSDVWFSREGSGDCGAAMEVPAGIFISAYSSRTCYGADMLWCRAGSYPPSHDHCLHE